jgi:succinoglycan biosynthesis transport protein ExoP
MAQNEKPAPAATAKAPQRPVGKSLFPTDSDTHILDRLNAIYKYRYVVATVFLLVLIAVAVRTFTTTPMYRATTSVLIEDERAASVAGFNSATSSDYLSDPEPYYQTQLRILTGRELAAKVVARLNLASVAEF